MEVVYAGEDAPSSYSKSVFLVGPTPRSQDVESWRPTMLTCLEHVGYDGVVFSPERRDGIFNSSYDDQAKWEKKHLLLADVVIAWVPRDLKGMPAFTTNVEFGTFIDSGKLLYGRPDRSPKNRYLDWLYEDRDVGRVHDNMISLAREAAGRIGDGALRTDGERHVPIHIWRMPAFQSWYRALLSVGNRLDDANVLWTFSVRGKAFSCALWAKVWINSEGRHKENEFVIVRSDISTVFAFRRDNDDFLESQVLLVKEYRVPARTADGFIHELPGGSSFKPDENPFEVAAHELEEETGIKVEPYRIRQLTGRQLAGTLSSHRAELFVVELSEQEMAMASDVARASQIFGVAEDSERTYLEVKTLREILVSQDVDWSTLGMVFQGIS